MKKKFTKIVSCLLCLAMLLSMAGPALAAAEDELFEEVVFAPDLELDDAKNIDAPDGDGGAAYTADALPAGAEANPFAATGEYEIYPTPQNAVYGTGVITLPRSMTAVYEGDIDVYTKDRAVEAFREAGIALTEAASATGVALRVSVGDTGNNSKYDAYKLTIDQNGVTVVGKDTDAAFYGLTTVKRIFQQVTDRQVKYLTVEDYADVPFRGFIEGYYGNPWTVEDRAALMAFGGDNKMNIYFYAPKDDPKHSTKWRELYTEKELETKIRPLAEAGNKSKCYYGFALHPFWADGIDYTDEASYAKGLADLKAKFEQVMKVGVRQIAILGDDRNLPAVGATRSYVRLMTDLTDWVKSDEMQRKYPGLKTSIPFCPNDYMGNGSSTQLQDLKALPDSVPVIMTGGQIWGHVEHSFLNTYRTNMNNGPFMWVNWPCSDNSKTSLTMGGHADVLQSDLTEADIAALKGVMINPMQQSEPSKAAIFQLADYTWNIWNGDDHEDRTANVWDDCFKYIDHDSPIETDTSAALRELSKHMIRQNGRVNGSYSKYDESIVLAPQLTAFRTKLNSGTLTAADVTAMRAEFKALYDAAVLYKGKTASQGNIRILGERAVDGSYPNNHEQMAPWLDCWVEFTQATIDLLDALACDLNNDPDGMATKYLSAQAALESSKTHRFWYVDHYEVAVVGGQHLAPFTQALLTIVSDKAMAVIDPSNRPLAGTVISNKNYYGSYTEGNLIDGDDDTYVWFNSTSAVNDYIGLDLGSVKNVGRIRFVVGGASSTDFWSSYKLQYSADNATWVDIKSYDGAGVKDETVGNINARYIRLLNLTAVDKWAQFSEFTVWSDSTFYRSEKVRRISGLTSSMDSTGVTLSASTVFLEPGQFVGIKLPAAHVLGGITADFTAADGLILEAGLNETLLEEVLEPKTYDGSARYIRLRNSSDQRLNFILRELSVTFNDPSSEVRFVSSTAGSLNSGENSAAWFDNDVATSAKYNATQVAGRYVLYDLGLTRSIDHARLTILNTDNDYPRNGVVEVSENQDGPWTTVLTVTTTLGEGQEDYNNPVASNGSTEWLHDTANFYYQENTLPSPVSARYIRYRVTGASDNWLRINEITLNHGAYVPVSHPSFTVDPTETRGNEPARLLDGNMTTGFQPDMTGRTSGSLIYHVSDKTNLSRITIVQNGSVPSNATVSVRTSPTGDVWTPLEGTLSSALNRLNVPDDCENVYDIKLTWGDVSPTFYEIITEVREEISGGGQASSEPETVPINRYSGIDRLINFDENWKFNLGDASGAGAKVYNDSSWRTIDLPHDYSIEQDYTSAGEAESAYLPGGIGWYRKAFTIDSAWRDKVVSINFGGVYMDTEVYLNGTKLGEYHYGYTPFSFVLPSDLLDYEGENVIAVKVNNTIPSSRWYSGSGIYRSTHLTVTDPVHVARYGTYVNPVKGTGNDWTVNIKTNVQNDGASAANVTVEQKVFALDGSTFEKITPAVASPQPTATNVGAGATVAVDQAFQVQNPAIWNSWDKGDPNLYVLVTTVKQGDNVLDTYETEFGFRTIGWEASTGFKLNGVNVKLKGVCQHHDQGGLGAEAWYRALERQVEILKDMGCNSIRVTHNPADDALIEICNRKGILIIDEMFDGWSVAKNGNSKDFARWFNVTLGEDHNLVGGTADMTWSRLVAETVVNRDKNAPCVIMYSIGNEVQEGASFGSDFVTIATNLIAWIQAIDSTRFITRGDNERDTGTTNNGAINRKILEAGGVVGFNYARDTSSDGRNTAFPAAKEMGWKVYAAETASHVNSRGIYNIKGSQSLNSDKRLTSYDKSCVGWGQVASDAWWYIIRDDYKSGEYVWTGFDYLGEPTPNNGTGSGWVNGEDSPKSSFFGIIDTNGLPKDNYWLYRSMWNDKTHTLHILPTWDREDLVISNGKVEVVVYSDAPMVKLYLNGVEVGSATSTTHTTDAGHKYRTFDAGTGAFVSKTGHQTLYATFNVDYAEGTLRAVACNADGSTLNWVTQGRSEVKTTSGATKLVAAADRTTIKNDGRDLSYVTISVTDQDGVIVNGAEPAIKVSVSGNGRLLALDNGVQSDHTSFLADTRKAGAGQLVAIVQSTKDEGSFTVTASSDGLASTAITITTGGVSSSVSGSDPVSYELSKSIYVQRGTRPILPDEALVHLADETSVTKAVTWGTYDEALLNNVGSEFAITGTIADYNIAVSIGVVVLDDIAALLNYSTAVLVGQPPVLPTSRPAVMANGTVVNAQFAVSWTLPDSSVYNKVGTITIPGTAEAFGNTYNVTATVRVSAGSVAVGDSVSGAAVSPAVNDVADNTLLNAFDGNASTHWTGSGKAFVRFDTSQNFYRIKLTYTGTAPTSGVSLKLGSRDVTVRPTITGSTATYELGSIYSEETVTLNFANQVSLASVELIVATPVFEVNSSAELTDLKINGQSVTAEQLASKNIKSSAILAVVSPSSDFNAAVTVLPETEQGAIVVVTESEDHSARATYVVQLDAISSNISATDDSHDYDRTKTTATAGSDNANTIGNAVDGNESTIWHSAYNNGSDEAGADDKLVGFPEKRWFQLELEEATELVALRYKPRASQTNGTVKDYRIETSMDGATWTTVAEGQWDSSAAWKLAEFDRAVTAKYVKLWGVNTYGDDGQDNYFMAAAEVRVVKNPDDNKIDLSLAMVNVYPKEFLWKNVEIRPGSGSEADQSATVTVTLYGEVLERGVDYVLGYGNNVDPGTAYIYATAPESSTKYRGTASTTFTIKKDEAKITSFENYTVRTQAGIAPTLPNEVWACMSDQRRVAVPVIWEDVEESTYINPQDHEYTVAGRVVDESLLSDPDDPDLHPTLTIKVAWSQAVDGVSVVTGLNVAPALPDTVTVQFDDGSSDRRTVAWDLTGKTFDTPGIVEIEGTVEGITRVKAKASVRVVGGEGMTANTDNIALNTNSTDNIFPFALAYESAGNNNPYQAIKGTQAGSTAATDRWSDWERNTYHTDPKAWMGVAFETTTQDIERKEGQVLSLKPHMVNKVKVMFVDESGTGGAVTFPADYEIQYYTGPTENLTFDTRISSGDTGRGNGRVRHWTGSPLLVDSNWTTVSYSSAKPAVPTSNGQMLEVAFTPVNTALVRVLVTAKSDKWVGIQALEAYDMSVTANSLFEVTSVKLDGVEKKSEFTTQTVDGVVAQVLEVTLGQNVEIPKLTVEATDNASVALTQAARVPGVGEAGAAWAKAVITAEDGVRSATYIVKFTREGAAGGYFIEVDIPTADRDKIHLSANGGAVGTEITVTVDRGYQLTDLWVQVLDGPREGELISTTGNKFLMPPGNVKFSASAQIIPYRITYLLNGGSVERHNTTSYNIKTPAFTLYNPTKPGYTFLGWVGGGLTAPTTSVTIDPLNKGDIGDRTYTAVWQSDSSIGGGGGNNSGGSGGGSVIAPPAGNTTVTTENRDGSTTVTTTNSDGLVSAVTTNTDGSQSAVIQVPQNSGSDVTAALPALEVTAEKTPEVKVQNNTGRPMAITVPVTGSNTIVAVRQEKDGTETIVPYSIVDEDGLRIKLEAGDQVLRLVDNAKDFDDVPDSHWAAAAVDFASSRELFNGMGSVTTFAPAAPMDRSMLTTVLWRLAEKPDASVIKQFDDVLAGSYYEQAVAWGVATGVVKGTDNGFEPNSPVTRETLAVMLYRAAGSPTVVDEMPRRFTDGAQVAAWAQEAMIWCIQNDIITGYPDNTLGSTKVASRAEVAAMLQRFVDHQV